MTYIVRLRVISFFAVIVFSCPAISGTKEEQLQVNLGAQIVRTHFLIPATPIINESMPIDGAPVVTVVFGSASKTLLIELTSPSGARFISGDSDTPAARIVTFPAPSDPASRGANYMFVLNNPTAGTWTYRISDTAGVAAPRAILLSVISSSTVRAAMLGGGQDYRVDREVRLALVVSEGANILRNVSIQGTVRNLSTPGPSSQLLFRDDGLSGDFRAGDGLYTGSFAPGTTGDFLAHAVVSGSIGLSAPFQRSVSASFRVQPVRATLGGAFTDRSIDTDFDTLIDQIGISTSINALQAGRYNLVITLRASNGNTLSANQISTFAIGPASREILFPAADIKALLGVDGPYAVAEIRLEQLDLGATAVTDAAFELGNTAAYSLARLERNAIELLAGGSAVGVDTNSNGKFDFLDVSLGVDLLHAGFYRWSGRLVDRNSKELALASGSGSYAAGQGTINLRFDGKPIGDNGIDGPYFLRNLIIFGTGEAASFNSAFTTPPLRAVEFEGFSDIVPPILQVSATPNVIWPPNHQMVEVKVSIQVSDNLDPSPTVRLESVVSNEGQNALGDGNTSPDIRIESNSTVFLRAERSGLGNDRIYTLTYSARDAAGNTATAVTQVRVPHDRR